MVPLDGWPFPSFFPVPPPLSTLPLLPCLTRKSPSSKQQGVSWQEWCQHQASLTEDYRPQYGIRCSAMLLYHARHVLVQVKDEAYGSCSQSYTTQAGRQP